MAPAQKADDPVNGYVLLGNHVTALQGALGLTADDVQAVLADNGLDIGRWVKSEDLGAQNMRRGEERQRVFAAAGRRRPFRRLRSC